MGEYFFDVATSCLGYLVMLVAIQVVGKSQHCCPYAAVQRLCCCRCASYADCAMSTSHVLVPFASATKDAVINQGLT